jgi:hypothetical protein
MDGDGDVEGSLSFEFCRVSLFIFNLAQHKTPQPQQTILTTEAHTKLDYY